MIVSSCEPSSCCADEGYSGPVNCCVNEGYSGPSNCCVDEGYSGPSNCCADEGYSGPSNCCVDEGYSGPSNCCVDEGYSGPSNCCVDEGNSLVSVLFLTCLCNIHVVVLKIFMMYNLACGFKPGMTWPLWYVVFSLDLSIDFKRFSSASFVCHIQDWAPHSLFPSG